MAQVTARRKSGSAFSRTEEQVANPWYTMVSMLAILVFPVCLLLAVSGALGSDKETLKRIESNMKCLCECPKLVADCGDECGHAPQIRAHIQQLLANGMTEEQVFAEYEKEYGQRIYGAPKPEGFNLVAWVLPFVVLTCGGVLIAVFLKNRKEPEPGPKTRRRRRSLSAKHRKMLRRELAE